MAMTMGSNADFEDLIQLFEKFGVRYLIVGAYAMAAYGVPRYTGDVDFFVEPTVENGKRIVEALREFGVAGLGAIATDFATSQTIFQIGVPPNRVDLICDIDGVDFESAWRNRGQAYFGPHLCSVISLKDLIQNKTATGRAKDIADVVALKEVSDNKGSTKS